ncbi:MAG TPA: 16S rRNA (adenine(1518)-N(6)/adenine(1519)-N(6))-dimethyltransferase RsmA [Chloroflexota bacterium]|nr:16S rRNA (adenine(1518)-N(6)/adenine(1519)-N(6))-dimethyltransferase RsmA [Chloroflexota bacterium]
MQPTLYTGDVNTVRPLGAPSSSSARRTLTLAEETRAILRGYRVRTNDQLGQNFLIDREALDFIIRAAAPAPGSQVLEIGPGIGTLTLALASTGAQIHALELDAEMARISADRTAGLENVTIHEGNVLHTDLADIFDVRKPFMVVANIPYYITAPILRLFLEGPYQPTSLILMVQKEVGERLAALPGEMSALTVFAQVLARIEVLRRVPPSSFMPPPEVESAIVRLRVHETPAIPRDDHPFLFRVVKAGFSAKRKMIHNSLNRGLPNSGEMIEAALAYAGVDRSRRAETLSIEEWRALSLALRADHQHTPKDQRL